MLDKAANPLSLEKIVNHLGGGILCCKNDDVQTIVYASSSFYRMIGYEDGEVTKLCGAVPDRVLSRDQRINWHKLAACLKKSGYVEVELKLIKKDGHHIWVSCCVRLMTEEDGAEYFCCIMEDITQKRRSLKREREQLETIKKAKQELVASEERYRIIMEQAADPIFDYNFKTQEFYCSPPFKEKFGLEVSMDGLLDKLCHSDVIFHEDRPRLMDDLFTFMSGANPKAPEYRIKDVNGDYRWYRLRVTVICSERDDPLRMIAFISDIDKQKKETLQLKEMAERDLLSGLYNHVTTADLVNKAISQSGIGSQHALFLVDIDNFKHVNDQLGHLLGDEVIEEISAKLRDKFREDDIIGRIGGDEFVVFLRNITSMDVKRKAEVLQSVFRHACSQDDADCRVSGSIGVAIYPKDGRDYHELFKKADAAMYAAKNSGKDAFCSYSNNINFYSVE